MPLGTFKLGWRTLFPYKIIGSPPNGTAFGLQRRCLNEGVGYKLILSALNCGQLRTGKGIVIEAPACMRTCKVKVNIPQVILICNHSTTTPFRNKRALIALENRCDSLQHGLPWTPEMFGITAADVAEVENNLTVDLVDGYHRTGKNFFSKNGKMVLVQ